MSERHADNKQKQTMQRRTANAKRMQKENLIQLLEECKGCRQFQINFCIKIRTFSVWKKYIQKYGAEVSCFLWYTHAHFGMSPKTELNFVLFIIYIISAHTGLNRITDSKATANEIKREKFEAKGISNSSRWPVRFLCIPNTEENVKMVPSLIVDRSL